ncbi:MAG: flagellar hook-length control protein FliK [Nitrospirae bacterium]|nr:flagellar hook-length control protein FliK [Nitrospirota bacterium]
MTSMPDAAPVQQLKDQPVSSPTGDSGAGESTFNSIVKNEMKNGTDDPGENIRSNDELSDCCCSEKDADSGSEVRLKNELKIDDALLALLSNAVTEAADTDDPEADLIINAGEDEGAAEGTPGLTEALPDLNAAVVSDPEVALLYALINQCGKEAEGESETCEDETTFHNEHDLKPVIRPSIADGKAEKKNNITDTESFSADPELKVKNEADIPDIKDMHAVKELTEQPDKDPDIETLLKSFQAKRNVSNSNAAETVNNLKVPDNGLMLEGADIGGKDGFKHQASNFSQIVKADPEFNNTNLANHSNTASGSIKPAEGLSSGNAARPSAFTQTLDNIVYIVKSNSKLGVTLEHDSLGKLDINLSMEKGMLNVHINASERTVREFIENNIQYIVDSLSKEGVSVGGFSVALKEHNDNPGKTEKVFIVNNEQEKEVVHERPGVSSVSGLVSVFA